MAGTGDTATPRFLEEVRMIFLVVLIARRQQHDRGTILSMIGGDSSISERSLIAVTFFFQHDFYMLHFIAERCRCVEKCF